MSARAFDIEVATQVPGLPVIAVGGIGTIDDVMEYLVAGASAVQIGTANFYDPSLSARLVEELPIAVGELKATRVRDIIGTLRTPLPMPEVDRLRAERLAEGRGSRMRN